MSLKKRIIAIAAAVVMACSLASCADTSYMMKADGDTIAAGVYINLMLTEYTNQVYSMYYSGTEIEGSFFDQKVDGVPMAEHLETYAYETCLKMVAVETKCEEMGIELTNDEMKEVNSNVKSYWDSNGDYYEKMGVSKDSLKRIQKYSVLTDKLFDALYGEGGTQEVTLEDVQKYVDENILRFKQIKIAKAEDDNGAAAKKLAEKYMEYAKEMDMDKLIDKYTEETSSNSDSDSTSSDDSVSSDSDTSNSDSADSTSSDDSVSLDDSVSSDSDTSNIDSVDSTSSDDGASLDDSVSSDSDASNSVSSDSDSSEEEKTEAQIESEKYPNDYLRDKSAYEDDKFIDYVAAMDYDKIELYEDDSSYYILERLDMAERTEFAKSNKESLVQSIKGEDFVKFVEDLADSIKVDKNEDSFKRYNAKDVYDRQVKWNEKNNSNTAS